MRTKHYLKIQQFYVSFVYTLFSTKLLRQIFKEQNVVFMKLHLKF